MSISNGFVSKPEFSTLYPDRTRITDWWLMGVRLDQRLIKMGFYTGTQANAEQIANKLASQFVLPSYFLFERELDAGTEAKTK